MKNAKPNMMKEMQANIIELMKTEGDNWTKSWVEVGLPMNIKTKKHYKGGNVFNLNFMVIKNSLQEALAMRLYGADRPDR